MRQALDVTLRTHRDGDLPEFVRISNAANEADGIDEEGEIVFVNSAAC